jgi:hypothetical protein
MLSSTTLITLYICATNPLIPITIFKIGKFTFIKTKNLFKTNIPKKDV